MGAARAGISEADWLATAAVVPAFILDQQQKIKPLRSQLTTVASEISVLQERIDRSSRNSPTPPFRDGPGFKTPERPIGRGRKRGGQPGDPGSGPELQPIKRVDEVVEHHRMPVAAAARCERRGSKAMAAPGDRDSTDHPDCDRASVVPPGVPLLFPSTWAPLPTHVEASRYGPRLSALVGLLISAFPLSFDKTRALLDQLLGVVISRGTITRFENDNVQSWGTPSRKLSGRPSAAGGLCR